MLILWVSSLTTPWALAQSTEATTLQARFADRDLVLLTDGQRAVLTAGRDALELPSSDSRRSDHLLATEDGWMASGTLQTEVGTEIFLLTGDASTWREHTVPRRRTSRWGARPVVEEGALRGLVWVEGGAPVTAGIRHSDWSGSAWSSPVWISPPGDGSQLAVETVELEEGQALAIWSAFDGTDDEILFSTRVEAVWSTPARIAANNTVPDITPTLAPLQGGAVAAWSTYDGNDYRVRVATFRNDEWSAPVWIGERGSVFPTFVFDPADPHSRLDLLFRTASTSRWSIAEVGAQGKLGRTYSSSVGRRRPPVVFREADGSLWLDWPQLERTAEAPGR